MAGLAFVLVACSALAGSPYRDHCQEIRVPVVVDALPQACVAKGQEYVAAHPEIFEDVDVIAFGCARRGQQGNTGERQ